MISEKISQRVLTVGEDYIDHRGGISAVINTYSGYFKPFKFVATYKPSVSKLAMAVNFKNGVANLISTLKTDNSISIVHIHGAAKGSIFRKYIVMLISKRWFKKKVIYHSHGSEFKKFYTAAPAFVKKIVENLINNADLLICLSNEWLAFFQDNFSQKNIVVLENIIDRPQLVEKQKTDIVKFLFLGFIGQRKGIFDLLDVIKDHKQLFGGRLQLIVGGNGETQRLEDYIISNQLQSLVRFEGWVSGEKKKNLLNEANVYILPSYNEGLPISILEAMSYGLPIISTPVGGIIQVVKQNVNGIIVNPGDKHAIMESLISFIENANKLTDMGNESEKIVVPYYAENVIPKLEKIYSNILIGNVVKNGWY